MEKIDRIEWDNQTRSIRLDRIEFDRIGPIDKTDLIESSAMETHPTNLGFLDSWILRSESVEWD